MIIWILIATHSIVAAFAYQWARDEWESRGYRRGYADSTERWLKMTEEQRKWRT